jgi:CO/xanthine dehydrogenase FAD-binding subunit
MTYSRVVRELPGLLPGLAIASRTVGSPQIRNRGTIVGNLGAASPAGDSHPPLLAAFAQYELHSAVTGARTVAAGDYYVGPKQSVRRPDELIAAVRVPVAYGPQQFSKIGSRNAMVIAACSFALVLDVRARTVGTGIGSAGPIPLRATEAERFLAATLTDGDAWRAGRRIGEAAVNEFAELVSEAARPIDDVRSTAAYRRHALAVMARRTLGWSLAELSPGRERLP